MQEEYYFAMALVVFYGLSFLIFSTLGMAQQEQLDYNTLNEVNLISGFKTYVKFEFYDLSVLEKVFVSLFFVAPVTVFGIMYGTNVLRGR